jgi:curved DNA-binding protein CbpA
MPVPEPLPTFDLYRALGLPPDAGPGAVEAAWRTAMKRHHPDQAGGDAAATERAKRLNVAHDWLADPVRRRRYDAARSSGRGATWRAVAPDEGRGSVAPPPHRPPAEPLPAPNRTEALLPIAAVAVIPLTFALLLGNGPILFVAGGIAAVLILYVAILLFVGLWTSRERERGRTRGRSDRR